MNNNTIYELNTNNNSINSETLQKINTFIKNDEKKISIKKNGAEYICQVASFTFLIPVIFWIIVSLSNNIMKFLVPRYPDKIQNYPEQLFLLYIHLLLIIISISLVREYFQPLIKNDHFAAAVFGLIGPVIVIFAGDFMKILKK